MCDHGDTVDLTVTLPPHLSHTGKESIVVTPVDRCIAPIVEALNAAAARDRLPGMRTAASCCGHGKGPGTIPLHDGRWLVIAADSHEARALQDATAELARVTAERDALTAEVEEWWAACSPNTSTEDDSAGTPEAAAEYWRAVGERAYAAEARLAAVVDVHDRWHAYWTERGAFGPAKKAVLGLLRDIRAAALDGEGASDGE